MVTGKVLALCCASMTGFVSSTVMSQSALDQLATAISEGTANVSLRWRSESVQQDNALRDASAGTLRTRLTLKTADVGNFSGLLEFDNVSTVGPDHYDSRVIDKYLGRYSVIADPVGSEVNQALIGYKVDEKQQVIVGRQRINHAAQRFVGGVAWRQNEQTFDAVTYQGRGTSLDVDYSYLWNVNRIFESSKPTVVATDFDSNSHIAHATYRSDWGNIGGYVYALDFRNGQALSSVTYGFSYSGKINQVSLNAAIARQSDYGDNPTSYDAIYLAADAAVEVGPAKILLGFEKLGSDNGRAAFATPLATLHKWQGWTDLFLATPSNGIDDVYVGVSGTLAQATIAVTYHDLQADYGNTDFGREWDISVDFPLMEHLSGQVKYATYDSDGFAVDTDKLWLSLNLAF